MNIGDKIKDKDGTIGIVVDFSDDKKWVQFRCRPYATLSNALTGNCDIYRERIFWNMKTNLEIVALAKYCKIRDSLQLPEQVQFSLH